MDQFVAMRCCENSLASPDDSSALLSLKLEQRNSFSESFSTCTSSSSSKGSSHDSIVPKLKPSKADVPSSLDRSKTSFGFEKQELVEWQEQSLRMDQRDTVSAIRERRRSIRRNDSASRARPPSTRGLPPRPTYWSRKIRLVAVRTASQARNTPAPASCTTRRSGANTRRSESQREVSKSCPVVHWSRPSRSSCSLSATTNAESPARSARRSRSSRRGSEARLLAAAGMVNNNEEATGSRGTRRLPVQRTRSSDSNAESPARQVRRRRSSKEISEAALWAAAGVVAKEEQTTWRRHSARRLQRTRSTRRENDLLSPLLKKYPATAAALAMVGHPNTNRIPRNPAA